MIIAALIGIVIGILLSFVFAVLGRRHEQKLESSLNRYAEFGLIKAISPIAKGQAVFIEPTPIEDEARAAVIEENAKHGKDTKVADL